MKKWTLHKFACIVNAIAVTATLLIVVHDLIVLGFSVGDRGLFPLLILILCYLTYIFADYWGMKLFYRYDRGEEVSNKHYRIVYTILACLGLVELVSGVFIPEELRHLLIVIKYISQVHLTMYNFMDLLLIIVFITGLILFITTVLLLKAIKKGYPTVKSEIDEIGADTTTQ